MTEIRFTRRALRDIRKMSSTVRQKLELAMDQLIQDRKAGDPLSGEWEGCWKLRAGDYRIIYRIASPGIIDVQYVRHRREAYRR